MKYPETQAELDAVRSEAKRARRAKQIEKMHIAYGVIDGKQCGDCANLITLSHAKDYHKCKLYGITGGPATDWRLRYDACGKFVQRDGERKRLYIG